MIESILNYIDHRLHKEQYFDTYIIKLISEKTNFNEDEIKVLKVSKSDIKNINEFDTFDFIYKQKIYHLDKANHLTEKANTKINKLKII
jgi:hypothetical protein